MIDVIANRYAEALFQIGEEENKTDNLYNELKEVSSLITTNNELNNVMKSPLVSKKEKIQLIDTLFAGKIDNDLKNFLKILIENAHNGKNNVPATKALKKVVIDDTINEISCAFDYLDYLKDNIKRLKEIKKYYDKMNSSNSEKQKNYYLEGMKMLFDKGETVENFEGILDEYKKALVNKETQIDKLNSELKEIRKLKI